MKNYSKIVMWVVIYLGSIGFILPELFSAKSNIAVTCGFLLVLVLFYRFITFFPTDKIKNFLKDMFN